MRCSQLSSTSSSFLSPMARATASGVTLLGPSRQPERTGHRGRHERGIGQRRQLDQPSAVGELAEDTAGDFQGEAGFADAAGSGQGHQTIGGHEVPQPRHRRRSANEACHGRGKIGHRRFAVDPHPLQTDRRLRRVVAPDGPVTEQAIAAAATRSSANSDTDQAPCGPPPHEPEACFP